MRIVVLGAAGGVGTQAFLRAAERGHDVVAAAREAPTRVPAGVEATAVDVRDGVAVKEVLDGADAVLWCVGVSKRSGGDVGRSSLPHVVAALPDGSRVITVSGAGVTLPADRKGRGARFVSALTKRVASDLVEDKEGEHAVLTASSLVWTEVRPPRLGDTPGSGGYTLTTRAPGLAAKPVSKADVALAMVELAESGEWARRSPFIVQGD